MLDVSNFTTTLQSTMHSRLTTFDNDNAHHITITNFLSKGKQLKFVFGKKLRESELLLYNLEYIKLKLRWTQEVRLSAFRKNINSNFKFFIQKIMWEYNDFKSTYL